MNKWLMCIFSATTLSMAVPHPVLAAERSPAQVATETLQSKGINVDNDSFIKEVQSGNTENITLFMTAGANAGMQNKAGTSSLMAALTLESDDVFQQLLATLPQSGGAAGAFDIQDNSGNTVLHKAIELGKTKQTETIIDLGASVVIANRSNTTPLMLAANQKKEELVKKILAVMKTSDPDHAILQMEDARGNTALTYAILNGSVSIATLLLDAGASASKPDSIGITPLMLAAGTGDEAMGKLLLDAGADVAVVNKSGESAIIIALKKGNGMLAKLLLQKMKETGAAVSVSMLAAAVETPKIDEALFSELLASVPASEEVPNTLLFKALDIKNKAIAQTLLPRIKDVNIRNDQNETLFYHAIDSGFEDIVLELLKRGADTGQAGASGSSAISRAVRHNMAKVVAVLLEKGASPDQKTSEGYTLAEMCVYNGYPETLEVLIAKGVKLEREFALLWSIRDGKGKAAPVLLAHGAVANIMNQDGTPAITLAAEAGQTEAVNAFIKYKATIDYPSKNRGITALGAAALAGHLEIVKALVEAGAKLEAKDNAGITPLAHAASLSRVAVVEYLISKGANVSAVDAQKRSVSDIAGLAASSSDRSKVMQLLADALKK